MFKKIVFFFVLISSIGIAQEKKLDSIKQLLETNTTRDSVRVKNLIQFTKYTATSDDGKSEELIKEAIEISKEISFSEGLGDSYSAYSLYYVRAGKYKEALLFVEKAKEIQNSINDIYGLSITNTAIANIYTHLNQPRKAIEIHLGNLALLKEGDPKKAASHFYIAKAYQEIEDYNNAEFHYKAAKNIALNSKFYTGIAIANSSLGIINVKKGKYQKGIEYLDESLLFFKENKQLPNIAHTYIELSTAYDKLNNVNKAILYNEKAIAIYKEQGILKTLKRAYLEQSNYFLKKEEYQKSNFYLKEHYKIKDSIFSNDNVKIIEEMKTKYETEKFEAQKDAALLKVTLAETESEKNRYYFIGASIILLLVILSSLFFIGRLREHKKAELITFELRETQKRLAIEKQYRDSELKALKSQMNPHFIFNALNSIQEYIVLNKKNLASDYLGKFSDLIRTYLHHSDTGVISLQEEIDSLKTYLDLERLRFEDTLNYSFTVAEDLNIDITHIPTMLLQPYIENALKHGLLHKKENRKISVSFSKGDANIIQCIIIDNGVGREKSKELQKKRAILHKPFAAKATEERLELLNFGKDKKIGVEIVDLYSETQIGNGTKVIVSIPILKH